MADPALSRRDLLMAGAVAAPAMLTARASAATAGAGLLRDQLLLDPAIRYFNAANIGPTFRAVAEMHRHETAAFEADPSIDHRAKYPVAADRLRERLASRLGVTPHEVAIVRNSSEANTVAVRGLALQPGDRVIVTEHNHPSTLDTWMLRAEREKLDIHVLPAPIAAQSPQQIVDGIAAAITPTARAIFLSHMTNVTGLIYPVAQIAQLAKAKGLWLHVDGAQTFGWMKLDLAALGVDSYSGSTHKWLMGPLEGGLLYVRRAAQPALHPLMLSHGYWLTDPANLATAQKYEILGQRDDPKLAAIAATLDIMDGVGEAAIEREARARGAAMRAALSGVPGVKLVGTSDPALSGPVIMVALPGKDVAAVRAMLWGKHRIATAAGKAQGQSLIRFSPHVYNSAEDIAAVAAALATA